MGGRKACVLSTRGGNGEMAPKKLQVVAPLTRSSFAQSPADQHADVANFGEITRKSKEHNRYERSVGVLVCLGLHDFRSSSPRPQRATSARQRISGGGLWVPERQDTRPPLRCHITPNPFWVVRCRRGDPICRQDPGPGQRRHSRKTVLSMSARRNVTKWKTFPTAELVTASVRGRGGGLNDVLRGPA